MSDCVMCGKQVEFAQACKVGTGYCYAAPTEALIELMKMSECDPKWKCKWCGKCVLCGHSLKKSYWHAFLYGVTHPFAPPTT